MLLGPWIGNAASDATRHTPRIRRPLFGQIPKRRPKGFDFYQSSNPETPVITVQSSGLRSTLPNQSPVAHSKIGITMNLYSYFIPDMQNELPDAVADVLIGKKTGCRRSCRRQQKRSPWPLQPVTRPRWLRSKRPTVRLPKTFLFQKDFSKDKKKKEKKHSSELTQTSLFD